MMKNIKEITGIFISSALIMFIVTVNLLGAACYLHIPMESAQSLRFGAKLFICGTVLIWALRMGMRSKKPIMWNVVTAAAAIYLNRLPYYSDAVLYSRLHLDIILPLLFIARIIANYAPGQRKKYAFSPCPVYRRGNAAAAQSSGYDSDFYDRFGRDIQDEYSAYEAEHIESHNRWLSQCEEEDNARYSAYEEEQSRYEAEETDRYYEEQERSTRDYYEQQRREEEDRYYYNNY